jgi:GTP-binding protein YchF
VNFTLFGYPKAGKTTLFNILTGARAEVTSYEEGKREPNEKIRLLPDARLDALARIYPERRKVAAAIDFVDLAGISYGEVKSSVFLNALRKADGLIHVARGFHDDLIPHARPSVSPRDDIRAMEEELLIADLGSIEARLEKLDKDLKKAKSAEGEKEREVLARLRAFLEDGKPLRAFPFHEAEEKLVRSFAFLSQKPVLHMINADESDAGRLAAVEAEAALARPGDSVLAFCGKIEREIQEIESEEEKRIFLAEFGLSEPTPGRFFPAALALMETIFFYTIGKDEVRAWPLKRHSTALRAAGAIHSDIEKGFIRAEVVPFDVLLGHGSLHEAKDKGAIRLEGKDYVVQDGDIIYFRFTA